MSFPKPLTNVPHAPNVAHMLTTSQAAEALGVDVSTIARLANAGDLKVAFKAPGVRGAMFFDPAEVERLRLERAS